MSQYVFPSSQSPYNTQQPVVYSPSSHSHHSHSGGYNYGTPLRRASSVGHTYASSPAYGYPTVVAAPQTQYLNVPDSHHRSRSHSRHSHSGHSHSSHSRPRHSSHSHQGHGHGYSTSATYPVTYATTAPVYIQPSSGHHRSHSTSHRHHSQSRPSHSHASNGDYYRGRAPSVGDRVRSFFGMEPSYYNSYGNQTHGRHNSYSGMRDEGRRNSNQTTRTGPWMFGSKSRGYVDEHGREVDDRGRPIHRY